MGWFTGVVLYALIWWVLLFAVLPIGTDSDPSPDPLTGWRGLPRQLGMRRKLILTSVLALLAWGGVVGVIESPWLNFRHGAWAIPDSE